MSKPRSRVVRAFSAGGVVYRLSVPETHDATQMSDLPASDLALSSIEVALVGYPRERVWTLPKGTPIEGEAREATAIREVQEETGLLVRIVAEVGSIHYWFTRKGVRYKKEVFHYLMEATGGDVSRHDHEYDEAAWFPIEEACQRLTHENEVEMVRRAQALILARAGQADLALDGGTRLPG